MSSDLTYRALGVAGHKIRAALWSHFDSADTDTVAAGMDWYPAASAVACDLAARAGVSADHMAAAISHLSPQCRWSKNVEAAGLLVRQNRKLPGILTRSFLRAQAALEYAGDPMETFGPRAPKTRAFAENIRGDLDYITVDSWAALAAGVHYRRMLDRKHGYERLALEYRTVADMAGVAPATFQAIVWCAVRGKAT